MRRPPFKGWKRWFHINCSMMLYEWNGGRDWVFTGTAVRDIVVRRSL